MDFTVLILIQLRRKRCHLQNNNTLSLHILKHILYHFLCNIFVDLVCSWWWKFILDWCIWRRSRSVSEIPSHFFTTSKPIVRLYDDISFKFLPCYIIAHIWFVLLSAMLLNIFVVVVFVSLCCLTGLVAYSKYFDCDPIKAKVLLLNNFFIWF